MTPEATPLPFPTPDGTFLMRRLIRLSAFAAAIVACGCSVESTTLPTEKPKENEASARPRPGEDGKMPKAGGPTNVPKGAMKPVAD